MREAFAAPASSAGSLNLSALVIVPNPLVRLLALLAIVLCLPVKLRLNPFSLSNAEGDPTLDVEQMARVLCEASARLVTISAVPEPGLECRLAYHWDVNGILFTIVAGTHARSIASIATVCPAADWAEREIHDYFYVFLRSECCILCSAKSVHWTKDNLPRV